MQEAARAVASTRLAWRELYEAHARELAAYLTKLTGDREAAIDLMQDTFISGMRDEGSLRDPAKVRPWLFRIATNLALNSLRDGRRHLRDLSVDQTDEDQGPGCDVIDPAAEIEETLVERERAKRIWAAVEALPEKQRVAVLLHKYQDLGYDEIARILGCSESALKSLLFRAYETLRVRLAPLAPDATGAGKGR